MSMLSRRAHAHYKCCKHNPPSSFHMTTSHSRIRFFWSLPKCPACSGRALASPGTEWAPLAGHSGVAGQSKQPALSMEGAEMGKHDRFHAIWWQHHSTRGHQEHWQRPQQRCKRRAAARQLLCRHRPQRAGGQRSNIHGAHFWWHSSKAPEVCSRKETFPLALLASTLQLPYSHPL